MDSPHLERALRIKSNSYRGGTIERIVFRDSEIGQVAEAVLDIDFSYEEGEGGPFLPTVRDVTLKNITCRESKRTLYLRGYKNDPIRDIQLVNVHVDHTTAPDVVENVEGLKR
jgi:polygalacturonase